MGDGGGVGGRVLEVVQARIIFAFEMDDYRHSPQPSTFIKILTGVLQNSNQSYGQSDIEQLKS